MRWSMCCILVPMVLGIPGVAEDVGASSARADSLYRAAMGQVGRVSTEESLEAFRRVVAVDRKHAPALYELGRLYRSLGTPVNRQSAQKVLKEAIRLDPTNLDYRIELGDLLWTQGFWYNAKREFEEVLEIHPQSAKAACEIGYYFLKEYLKYRNMRKGVMSWGHWGEKYRSEALAYFDRSIENDPGFLEAYYQLGVLFYESNQPGALVRVAEALLARAPGDKDALLFCGLGYQATGDEEEAHRFYRAALERMGPEERALMESVEVVAGREEQRAMVLAVKKMGEGTDEAWERSSEFTRFWRKWDPLFLTAFNERRMEHYGRVAYANLAFGRPSRGIAGWRTDMGRTHIKFGRPVYRTAQRPEIEFGGMGVVVEPHLETWVYEGFNVWFQNWDGLDGWYFGTQTKYGRGSGGQPESRPAGRYVFQERPTRYVDPYRTQKYRMPYQVAVFQEGDSVRVELAYALPKFNVSVSEEAVDLENGVFLFDEDWEEVYQQRRAFSLPWPEIEKSGSAVVDSLRGNHLVFHLRFRAGPGKYHLVGEVRDREKPSIGTFREVRTFPAADTLLQMSDLLLAGRIEARTPFPEGRKDLEVIANPLRTYHRSEPVFIYLEVYNFKRD